MENLRKTTERPVVRTGRNRFTLITFLLLSMTLSVSAQEVDSVIYKQIDTVALQMDIYYPEQMEAGRDYPAMVFFFGGGWNGGSVSQFEPHARYLSKRGIVCFLADYRVRSRQKTTPFESLMDAKSAIRYIRKNAARFRIDPDQLIASGGSAGGHLAAATALVQPYNESTDDLSVSCVPNALVLFNPVIDNGPGGYGFERIGEHFYAFSPLHNIRAGAPPTIFFLGTEDRLIPVATGEYYQTVMEKVGSRCDLHLYEGAGHGFFNYRSPEFYYHTVLETDKFLESLGYLEGEPTLRLKVE
ncbi:alpha/beta hydrolase [Flavilitoribacter nigricans]|nr:alpha/beta hydrolase [Flavilitoribacter nigricans]